MISRFEDEFKKTAAPLVPLQNQWRTKKDMVKSQAVPTALSKYLLSPLAVLLRHLLGIRLGSFRRSRRIDGITLGYVESTNQTFKHDLELSTGIDLNY